MLSRKLLPVVLLLCSPLLTGGTTFRADFNQRLLAAHNDAAHRCRGRATGMECQPCCGCAGLGRTSWRPPAASSIRPDEPGKQPQGENLWAGTPRAFAPEAMVHLWAAEKNDYRPGVFPNISRSGDVERVGHYTQMIWRASRQVGCATAVGAREEFLVCRYSEAGNVYGERPA